MVKFSTEIKELFIIWTYVVLEITLILLLLYGTQDSSKNVSDFFKGNILYLSIYAIFLPYLTFAKIMEFRKGVNTYVPIFDPEKSVLYKIHLGKWQPFKWIDNPFHSIIIYITTFGIFSGIIGSLSGSFTAIPQSLISGLSSIKTALLSAIPSAGAETILFVSIASIELWFLNNYRKKHNLSKEWFTGISLLVLAISIGILGVIIHQAVYGGLFGVLFFTGIFWALGISLTFLFGNILIFLIFHLENNFFAGLNKLGIYSPQEISIITISIILLINILYWTTFYFYKQRSARKNISTN